MSRRQRVKTRQGCMLKANVTCREAAGRGKRAKLKPGRPKVWSKIKADDHAWFLEHQGARLPAPCAEPVQEVQDRAVQQSVWLMLTIVCSMKICLELVMSGVWAKGHCYRLMQGYTGSAPLKGVPCPPPICSLSYRTSSMQEGAVAWSEQSKYRPRAGAALGKKEAEKYGRLAARVAEEQQAFLRVQWAGAGAHPERYAAADARGTAQLDVRTNSSACILQNQSAFL